MEGPLLTYIGEFIPTCNTDFVPSTAANNFAKGTLPQFFPCVKMYLNQKRCQKREGVAKNYGAHCIKGRFEQTLNGDFLVSILKFAKNKIRLNAF